MRRVLIITLAFLATVAAGCHSSPGVIEHSVVEVGAIYNLRLAEEPNVVQAKILDVRDDGWFRVELRVGVEGYPSPGEVWINPDQVIWISLLDPPSNRLTQH